MADPVLRLDDAPGFNADRYAEIQDAGHLKPDGSHYSVLGKTTPDSMPPFIKWVRGKVKDKTNELVAHVNSLRTDVDYVRVGHDSRLDKLEADVKALQEAPQARPFP